MLDRPGPGLQKIRPERDDVPGAAEVVCRELIEAEDLAVCGPKRLEAERLVAGDSSTQCTDPLGQQIRERPSSGTGDRRDPVARCSELGSQAINRLVPADLLELPVP